jgi:hypothetical protein
VAYVQRVLWRNWKRREPLEDLDIDRKKINNKIDLQE